MKKFVLAPALAALAMFLWGFLFWGAPHHLPYKSLGHVDDDSATALALGKLFPATGTYLVPNPTSGDEKMAELVKRGPIAEVHITKESMDMMNPTDLTKGYLQEFVLCFILAIMLGKAEPSFKCFSCRVKFSAAIGLLLATCTLGDVIWWHHSLSWQLWQAFYELGSVVIAGFVLAFFFTPKATVTSPAAA